MKSTTPVAKLRPAAGITKLGGDSKVDQFQTGQVIYVAKHDVF